MFKKLLIAIISLVFLTSCATQLDIKRLEDQMQKQSRTDILKALEGSAGTKMYGRVVRTGTNSMAAMSYSGLATGDICVVVDSNLDMYFYKYDSTSALANNDPWVIRPTVPDSPATGRWLLIRGLVLKNDDINQSYLRLYEDYTTGQNYYEILAPSSIASNSSFYLGRWRISAITFTSASVSITVDDTYTLYYCTTTGLTGNYGISLPAATGTGAVVGVYVVDDSSSYRIIIEPNGTNRIVGKSLSGTNSDGSYVYASDADTTGAYIQLVDAASGRWVVTNIIGAWSWE